MRTKPHRLSTFVAGLLTGASEALSVVVTRTVSNASPAQDLTDCAGSLFFESWQLELIPLTGPTVSESLTRKRHIIGKLGVKLLQRSARIETAHWKDRVFLPRLKKQPPINTLPTILRLTMPRRWLKHGGHANQGHLKSSTITEKVVSEHPHLGAWSYAEVSECIGVPKPSAKNCLPSLSESQSFERESVRDSFSATRPSVRSSSESKP